MPELPAVEFGRGLAEGMARGREIVRVRCVRDEIVYEGVSGARFRRVLTGRTVLGVHRRGKHIFFELDRRPWPVFHFGMTGAFRVPGNNSQNLDHKPLELISSGCVVSEQWPPPFTKIHLWFDDGGELVMTNQRRFGRIRLREDPRHEPPLSKLGFDPLIDLPPPGRFVTLLQKRKAPIKSVLLDQSFAAGVGNWIADDILYAAKIDPRRRASELTEAELKCIRVKLKHVITTAVRVNGDKDRFPKSWLYHRRWGKKHEATTISGQPLEFIIIGGRTTCWAPEVQG